MTCVKPFFDLRLVGLSELAIHHFTIMNVTSLWSNTTASKKCTNKATKGKNYMWNFNTTLSAQQNYKRLAWLGNLANLKRNWFYDD